MRRPFLTLAGALALTAGLAACSFNSKSSSTTTTSKSSSSTSATSKSGANCLVGTWTASAKDLGLFKNDKGSTDTYSTPTGSVQYEFTENGNFVIRFDNVQTIYTSGGTSSNLALNGSIGGTYTVNNNTFTTNTTKFNIATTADGISVDASGINAAAKDADKESQGFTCSGNKITIKHDDGSSETLSAA